MQLGLRSSKMACTPLYCPAILAPFSYAWPTHKWNPVQNFLQVLEFVKQFPVPSFFVKESKQMNRFSIENSELSIIFAYRMMRHVCALCEQSGVASTTVEKYLKFRTSSRILFWTNDPQSSISSFWLLWGKVMYLETFVIVLRFSNPFHMII
jgi:hypothetical protein